MRLFIYLLAFSLLILFAGCTTLKDLFPSKRYELAEDSASSDVPKRSEEPLAEPQVFLVPQITAADQVLYFLARFQALPPAQQAEEYRRIVKLYEANGAAIVRFQLASALLTPGKNFSNALRGRQLLQEYLDKPSGEKDLVALAGLLVAMVDEREKLERQLAREKENSETLARQLNELRNIENIMRQREVNGRPGL